MKRTVAAFVAVSRLNKIWLGLSRLGTNKDAFFGYQGILRCGVFSELVTRLGDDHPKARFLQPCDVIRGCIQPDVITLTEDPNAVFLGRCRRVFDGLVQSEGNRNL